VGYGKKKGKALKERRLFKGQKKETHIYLEKRSNRTGSEKRASREGIKKAGRRTGRDTRLPKGQ